MTLRPRVPRSTCVAVFLFTAFVMYVSTPKTTLAEWAPGNPTIPGTYTPPVTLDINADTVPDVTFFPHGGGGGNTVVISPLDGSVDAYSEVFASGDFAMRFELRDEILNVTDPYSLTFDPVTLPTSFHDSLGYVGILLVTQSTLPGGGAEAYRAYLYLKTTSLGLVIVETGFEPRRTGTVKEPPEDKTFWLGPCVPNPVLQTARLTFSLGHESKVVLELFDVSGRRVRRLVDARLGLGVHSLSWSAEDDQGQRVPAGVYYYRLSADGHPRSGRLVVAP